MPRLGTRRTPPPTPLSLRSPRSRGLGLEAGRHQLPNGLSRPVPGQISVYNRRTALIQSGQGRGASALCPPLFSFQEVPMDDVTRRRAVGLAAAGAVVALAADS